MVYLIFISSIIVFGGVSYLLISFEKRKLELSTKYYNKAIAAYRLKNYQKTLVTLKKSLIIPSNNIINKEEAMMNVKVLHLLDLVLLHNNMDGEALTGELRTFLNDVHGIVNVDQKYFEPVKTILRNAHQINHLNQEQLEAILFEKGTNEISIEMLRDWRVGLNSFKFAARM
jgi:hypothetical protein